MVLYSRRSEHRKDESTSDSLSAYFSTMLSRPVKASIPVRHGGSECRQAKTKLTICDVYAILHPSVAVSTPHTMWKVMANDRLTGHGGDLWAYR
jgi:hypothetical protein